MDFSQIKSQKLVNLMQKSAMFNALSESDKQNKIAAVSKLPISRQDGIISDFFMKSNDKEEEDNKKRSFIFKVILEKIKEMDIAIKRMERKEVEGIQNREEAKTEEDLVNQLNTL